MSSNFFNALAGTRLYPITDRKLSGLSHKEQVSCLIEGGAKIIQLREKSLSSLEFYREATDAVRRGHARSSKIIINDRVDIALALRADGVHLGQNDLPPEAARELLGPDAIIGFSTHNLEQVLIASRLPVDYIAVGPIFATSTKQSSETALGLDGLRQVRNGVGTFPLVAIGGITLQNSYQVLDAGADAIAMISDIWIGSGHATSRTKRLLYSSK